MKDLIIIGAGPAGLTASIYASCFHLNHLVIGKILGGQMVLAPDILNYPGFERISGKELTRRMIEQVKKRGGEILTKSVIGLYPSEFRIQEGKRGELVKGFEIETQEGDKYQTRAIILATGTERRKLNVPGEREYTGRGVYYCATCEKEDYTGKVCGVVGGGNSALQAAVELSQAASQVYIIYRGEQLRGDAIWLEQVEKNQKIAVMYDTVVEEIRGDGSKVTAVTLNSKFQIKNAKLELKGQKEGNYIYHLPLDKLFIEIGGVPGTALVIPLGVKMDSGGYIIVNEELATNVPGIFAAGDLVSSGLSIEQICSAVGLGARAAFSAFAYLKKEKAPILWGEGQIKR